jgi:putative acetyltransferase
MTGIITIQPANPALPEARRLIEELDAFLGNLYPAECNHLLSVEVLQQPTVTFLVAYLDNKAVGCGAYINHSGEYAEIKRMYVMPAFRDLKIGRRLLKELESRARATDLPVSRLETGVYQMEAIALYTRAGYKRRGAFGNYRDDEQFSVFMEKSLK